MIKLTTMKKMEKIGGIIKFVFYNKLERDNNYSTRKMAIMIKQWMYNRTALPKKEEKIVQTYYPPDAFIVNNVVFPSSLLVFAEPVSG